MADGTSIDRSLEASGGSLMGWRPAQAEKSAMEEPSWWEQNKGRIARMLATMGATAVDEDELEADLAPMRAGRALGQGIRSLTGRSTGAGGLGEGMQGM